MKKDTEASVTDDLNKQIAELSRLRKVECYSMIVEDSINVDLVDTIYEELRNRFGAGNDRLEVLVENSGGDIDAAYNLAQLFRR